MPATGKNVGVAQVAVPEYVTVTVAIDVVPEAVNVSEVTDPDHVLEVALLGKEPSAAVRLPKLLPVITILVIVFPLASTVMLPPVL